MRNPFNSCRAYLTRGCGLFREREGNVSRWDYFGPKVFNSSGSMYGVIGFCIIRSKWWAGPHNLQWDMTRMLTGMWTRMLTCGYGVCVTIAVLLILQSPSCVKHKVWANGLWIYLARHNADKDSIIWFVRCRIDSVAMCVLVCNVCDVCDTSIEKDNGHNKSAYCSLDNWHIRCT